MKFDEIVKFDKRHFLKILWHYVFVRFSPISSFFYPSISNPIHLRISQFFLLMSLNWFINAVLFSDELIRQRNLETNKLMISVNKYKIKIFFVINIFIFNYNFYKKYS